jgi:hypothetical protein
VEADTVVRTTLVQQQTAPAGLVRLSHTMAGGTGYIYDNSSGARITAYVVDTGIRLTHSVSHVPFMRTENRQIFNQEFQGRAIWGNNFINTNLTSPRLMWKPN